MCSSVFGFRCTEGYSGAAYYWEAATAASYTGSREKRSSSPESRSLGLGRSSRARTSCPSSSMQLDPVGRGVVELDRLLEPGPKPSREERGLLQGASHAQPPGTGSEGELGDRPPPAERARPDDVGDGDAVEDLDEARVAGRRARPLARVDDEAVDDVHELLEGRLAERRLAAPAEEHGHIREDEREDHAGGRLGDPPAQPELDHLGTDVPVELLVREALQRQLGIERVAGLVLREQEQRAGRMQLRHARERLARDLLPLGRRPRDVRHHTRAHVHRLAAKLRELALDLPDRDVATGPLLVADGAQCRLQERPSRWSSSSPSTGPHVPAS